MTKIGFIGAGNMGTAMIRGLAKAKLIDKKNLFVCGRSMEKLHPLASEFNGIQLTTNAENLAEEADIIILSVKPYTISEVITNIQKKLTSEKIIISVAAGVTIADLEKLTTPETKIIRVMPNTPALVGEGMSSISSNASVTTEETAIVAKIFSSFGKAEVVPESLMDAVVGVSGSSPAYVYMFIEALADGAVLNGLPRDKAYKFAAQAVLGAAKMVLETGEHPGKLKDMVTSPGGTTIEAVKSLEDNGFRSAVINAVQAAASKNSSM
ncbi:pyrroline-5-carboxylate reductase [Listeria ivanovii]|uniref:Pyrroline-5-carboxylate reductase n=2 Tax=Listeria ivanovii TaxID=1638 RepID=A0ABS1G8K1_LISIV|nr:pyrroline-5-carboxylate reductase [Listeria ivanovii]EFR98152.1 pyrroline-5-carboxylate reductase [Listeria ivanovii FSL F6-596]AIS58840.1 pyrroline-5-carboxylate reductase [Listeria ivanovii subsp. londoniensis]AIS61645.1 pyrroline-5-carboxylate reductase [Listeria ivanovii subsp. londoniensis]MBK1963208.1 pyrroline-5-carboxylate reductase [Listeria ivanovii subsp. londoniensis]MBK1965924.1 pyrroline-5-carboxylate reductase [Listeria ivanovii subsp. londoniensis]